MKFLVFTALFFSLASSAQSKLLDKIVAVMNDKIITQSQVKRMQATLEARKNISPQIYSEAKYTDAKFAEIAVNRFMVREKLAEMGYIITDDQVESQIKSTEERLGLNRQALLSFLKGNGISFDEYFEIIRETIEFNIFSARVIRPLISVTDQEVKNEFYKRNSSDKSISFKYDLVIFSLPTNKANNAVKKDFKEVMVNFQNSGVLPERFSNVDTNVIGEISEEGLNQELRNLLKATDEGSFTDAIDFNNRLTVFFIKKKDLVESENYQKAKDFIREQLAERLAGSVTDLWFQRERNLHYIKFF